jgi:diacylglycerol O-acyltransferase / wax synthase
MTGNRLSALDTAFLCLESESAPMHLGALAVFGPGTPSRPARLLSTLGERAQRLPLLRRRVSRLRLPGTGDTWEPDPRFEVGAHVRLHRLDGEDRAGVAGVAARLMTEPLDRARPLWELHLLTGLAGGGFAVLVKLHHALADGLRAVELGLGLLDGYTDLVAARSVAGPAGSLLGGVWSAARAAICPYRLVGRALDGVREAAGAAGIAGAVLSSARPRTPSSPLATTGPAGRRLALLRLSTADVRQVRRGHGGTDNDVLLTVLAGALRDWLDQRGQRPQDLRLRALVPVSRRCRPDEGHGNTLSGYLCDLPVQEDDAASRLRAVRASMDRNKAAGPGRGPGALPLLADRVPAAVHRIVAPLARHSAGRLFDTVVTNVPVPDLSLALGGTPLCEVYPIVPLASGQALGVALSAHRGTVHIGLHADARAVPDLDRLAEAIPAALTNLRAA